MSAVDYLAKLNPQQRCAVEHGLSKHGSTVGPPLLVLAGAGSGKTNTLAHRVAHLIVHGADPARILLLTFSRRAAAEMERRAERIVAAALGERAPRGSKAITWSGTFHAIGARLLRLYAGSIGLEPSFTIHDREDSADLINLVRHELGLSEKSQRFPLKATCLAIYSRAVNAREPLELVLNRHFPWCAQWEGELRRLFEAYVAAKQQQNVLDYDDLLLYWAELMQVPELATEIGARFDHVLVDEYQDTNALQAAVLRGLKPDGAGLMVVGDDAQAIYGFRAATVRNILDIPAQFGPRAVTIKLEQNYRSTQAILDASNAVIGLAREGFTKTLRTERAFGQKPELVTVLDEAAQVGCIVEAILASRECGIPLKRQAVLFRTSHHSAMLEIELARRNIPFVKFGGLKFIEAAHVKDMLAVLRWAENPADRVTGFRVLLLLPGIGPAGAARILDQLADGAEAERLARLRPPPRAAEAWNALAELLTRLRRAGTQWPEELDLVRQWYQPYLEDRYPDAAVREADLDQLQRIAAGSDSRTRFLTDLTLDPPSASSDEAGPPSLDEDYLVLSTIHSAKGREWKAVYVMNVVDGCIPSDMATGCAEDIEEERRLLYVAMTRAEDRLMLVTPQRFYVHHQAKQGDKHVYAIRSRFIPASLLGYFDAKVWPTRTSVEGVAGRAGQPAVDLKARLRGTWRATGT